MVGPQPSDCQSETSGVYCGPVPTFGRDWASALRCALRCPRASVRFAHPSGGNGNIGTLCTSGLPDAVAFSLDDYSEGLTVLHSHTNTTTFSVQDFVMLFNPKVEKVGVVGHNGDVYLAYVGNGWLPSLDEFEADVNRIRQEANITIMEDPDFFSWSIEERNYMAIKEQAYRIARNYGWIIEGGRTDD